MSDCVAGGVEEVETPVVEIIIGVEAADFQSGGEVYLMDFSALEIGFKEPGVRVRGVGRQVPGFEVRSYDQLG